MLWPMLITLALVKLTAAFTMLWLPFRTDSAVVAVDDEQAGSPDAGDDEDGGSKVAPAAGPADPHPRRPRPTRPRRGPHGSRPSGAPPRVRIARHREQLRANARHVRADRLSE